MKRAILFLGASLIAAAAVAAPVLVWCTYHRYDCVIAERGLAYKMDRLTGATWLLVDNKAIPVYPDNRLELAVIMEQGAKNEAAHWRKKYEALSQSLRSPVPDSTRPADSNTTSAGTASRPRLNMERIRRDAARLDSASD